MKKHLSVLMLQVRSVIYKLLLLFIVMTAAEVLLFWRRLEYVLKIDMSAAEKAVDGEMYNPYGGIEMILDDSHIAWVFLVAFVLTGILLCRVGCEIGSKQGYTLRRLRVSEPQVFMWQAVCNVGCYLLLWLVQVAVMIGLCYMYTVSADPLMVGEQTVFLAFYRNDLLHNLLPLEETLLWIRNAIMVIGLGMAAACYPYRQRRKSHGIEIIALTVFSIIFFVQSIGSATSNLCTIILFVIISLAVTGYVRGRELADEA